MDQFLLDEVTLQNFYGIYQYSKLDSTKLREACFFFDTLSARIVVRCVKILLIGNGKAIVLGVVDYNEIALICTDILQHLKNDNPQCQEKCPYIELIVDIVVHNLLCHIYCGDYRSYAHYYKIVLKAIDDLIYLRSRWLYADLPIDVCVIINSYELDYGDYLAEITLLSIDMIEQIRKNN
jgi:hypothetical protein